MVPKNVMPYSFNLWTNLWSRMVSGIIETPNTMLYIHKSHLIMSSLLRQVLLFYR